MEKTTVLDSVPQTDFAGQMILQHFEKRRPICHKTPLDLNDISGITSLVQEHSGVPDHQRFKRDSCGYSPFTIFPYLAFIKSLATALVLILNNINK